MFNQQSVPDSFVVALIFSAFLSAVTGRVLILIGSFWGDSKSKYKTQRSRYTFSCIGFIVAILAIILLLNSCDFSVTQALHFMSIMWRDIPGLMVVFTLGLLMNLVTLVVIPLAIIHFRRHPTFYAKKVCKSKKYPYGGFIYTNDIRKGRKGSVYPI